MEQHIKDKFTPAILDEVLKLFGLTKEDIKLLGGFESFMYEFTKGGQGYVLRIGHSSRRSAALTHGEVDWINTLASNDVSAVRAVPSARGNLVESVPDGLDGHFLATAFVKAAGGHPRREHWLDDAFAEHYGQQIGRMHAISTTYQVPDPSWRRPEWDAPGNLELEYWLPESEHDVIQKFHALKDYLDTLPRSPDAYGMIHQDAHAGNLFVDDSGRITFFDFDDCVYGWFVYDIAMVLFYAANDASNPTAFLERFIPHFLSGYRGEKTIDGFWLQQIPHFMKLREIDLYAIIHRSFDVNHLEDDPWVARYMRGRRDMILNDVPFVSFDFSTLS